jgi:threonine synthase
MMRRFRAEGRMPVPDAAWRQAAQLFRGFALGDEATLAEIRRLREEAGYLADPHTAIGTAGGDRLPPGRRLHPRRGRGHRPPGQVPGRGAAGHRHLAPPLPPRLADLYEREERYSVLPADLGAIEAFVRRHSLRNAA